MSAIKRYMNQKEAERHLKIRNRMHENLRHTFENSSKHPEWKILPACTKYYGTDDIVAQFWYHYRMSQHNRIEYYVDLTKRFKRIAKAQADFRKDQTLEWVEFPSELIDELLLYESDPSDELIHLAVSEPYRRHDHGQTFEEEKRRLIIDPSVLKGCQWRDFVFSNHELDDGTLIVRAKTLPGGKAPPELFWSDWDVPTLIPSTIVHNLESDSDDDVDPPIALLSNEIEVDYEDEDEKEPGPRSRQAEVQVTSENDQEEGEVEDDVDSNASTLNESEKPKKTASKVILRAPDKSSSESESSSESDDTEVTNESPRVPKVKLSKAKKLAKKKTKNARKKAESVSSSSSPLPPQALVATRQIPVVEPLASLSRGHIDKFKLSIEALRRAQDVTAISVFIPEPLQRLLTLQFFASFHIKKDTRIE